MPDDFFLAQSTGPDSTPSAGRLQECGLWWTSGLVGADHDHDTLQTRLWPGRQYQNSMLAVKWKTIHVLWISVGFLDAVFTVHFLKIRFPFQCVRTINILYIFKLNDMVIDLVSME